MLFLSSAKPNELSGTALLRLDFNTQDEWRMVAALPTVRLLLRRAEKVVVVSHRGRPTGVDPRFSLQKDARILERHLKRKVIFFPHANPDAITRAVARAPRRSLILLENLRFYPGENENDKQFARSLAGLADYYVNDAFPVSHRAAASVVAITKFLPSYAGLVLEKEIDRLSRAMRNPKRPLVIILGGGKAHDKLGVAKHFERTAEAFILGGASANSVMGLRGVDVGASTMDTEPQDRAMLVRLAKNPRVIAPVDWLMEKNKILDIGPKTEKLFAGHIARAQTVIWSGPMGLIEKAKFAKGNLAVARAIVRNRRAFSLTGGGETVMFLKKHHLDKKFGFISTGGGAMLEFLAGEKLPGIEALKKTGRIPEKQRRLRG